MGTGPMKGARALLEDAYTIDDAAGVGQFVAVVIGANDGGCKKPTGANAANCLGITIEAQTHQGKGVSVRLMGQSFFTAKGAINFGDHLNIASSAGDLQSVETGVNAAPGTAAQLNIVGIALGTFADGMQGVCLLTPGLVIKTAAS